MPLKPLALEALVGGIALSLGGLSPSFLIFPKVMGAGALSSSTYFFWRTGASFGTMNAGQSSGFRQVGLRPLCCDFWLVVSARSRSPGPDDALCPCPLGPGRRRHQAPTSGTACSWFSQFSSIGMRAASTPPLPSTVSCTGTRGRLRMPPGLSGSIDDLQEVRRLALV